MCFSGMLVVYELNQNQNEPHFKENGEQNDAQSKLEKIKQNMFPSLEKGTHKKMTFTVLERK